MATDFSLFALQRDTLKRVVAAFKPAGVPFALAGGYAVWARGGVESTHDVDFIVDAQRVVAAAALLEEHDFTAVDCPEDWLMKVGRSGVVVDLIHRLPIGEVDATMLARCDEVSVDSVRMPVLPATDLLLCRLLALGEHACDFAPVLGFARSLREQVDWDVVRRESKASPFARAFLTMLTDLEVVPGGA